MNIINNLINYCRMWLSTYSHQPTQYSITNYAVMFDDRPNYREFLWVYSPWGYCILYYGFFDDRIHCSTVLHNSGLSYKT